MKMPRIGSCLGERGGGKRGVSNALCFLPPPLNLHPTSPLSRCTSYFYVKSHPLSPSSPSDYSPTNLPASTIPSTPTQTTPSLPSQRAPNNPTDPTDPNFGLHWPSTPLPSIPSTLHNTESPESAGVPSSKTWVWDLLHEDHLSVSDGTCPSGAPKCCPKKDPLRVWANQRNPLLAICSGVTTRGIQESDRHPGHLALFLKLMPSIVNTFDCDVDYVVVVGYDKGDQFYDTVEGQKEVRTWFEENMAKPMAAAGVTVTFVLVEVKNDLNKPGPVFNAMLREAYKTGADYFYRLNDDSELKMSNVEGGRSWVKVFIDAVNSFQPPYGVVGPWGGLDRILTHDFVHRTHLDIFQGVYYPHELVDWYMDDWVSHVYGKERTIKAKEFVVEHHTFHHGQRYKVNRGNERLLKPLIRKGREKIGAYAEGKGWANKGDIVNDVGKGFKDLPGGR
jgi:hypothetical protein